MAPETRADQTGQALQKALQTEQISRLDRETAALGVYQTTLLELLLECSRKHQELDLEYAPRVNVLLQQVQAAFDSVQTTAHAARELIVKPGSKSAKRMSGNHAWRKVPRITLLVTDEELIARLRASGQQISRRFVRVVRRYEVNREALLAAVNRDLVRSLPDVALDEGEDYTVTPSGGFAISSGRALWPTMEGLPLPAVMQTILHGTDGKTP